MALPITYNLRNVVLRWRVTLTTILGIALVVAVFVLVQSLAAGLEKSRQNTGDPRNVMIVRKGSTAESSSIITREQLKSFHYWPEIARDEQDRPVISADVIVLVSLPRKDGRGEANVLFRGLSPQSMALRPQVSLIAGRWFEPGQREVVVSHRLAARFASFDPGESFRTAGESFRVVGWIDGQNSAFDSEIWGHINEVREVFDREYFSSVLARVPDAAAADRLAARLDSDKRLPLRALPETEYYSA